MTHSQTCYFWINNKLPSDHSFRKITGKINFFALKEASCSLTVSVSKYREKHKIQNDHAAATKDDILQHKRV